MTTERQQTLERLADCILERANQRTAGVLRVALTGITACGKTTMADELTAILTERGRTCINIAVDDFHMPRAHRHQRGRESAEGYYYDAFNYDLLKAYVLEPLGPGGDLRYKARGFDLHNDVPFDEEARQAHPGDIILFSASFLFRPEIVSYFDYRIFIDVDFDLAAERGAARDAASLGSLDKAQYLYRVRYHAAQRLYIQEVDPQRHADIVIDNNDIDHPFLKAREDNENG